MVARKRKEKKTKSWYEKKYNALDLAAKAMEGVKYLKGLVNAELKRNQINGNVTSTYNGGALHISGMAQGDSENSRDGDSILARYINIRGHITYNASSSKTSNVVRVMLVRDRSVNGTAVDVAQILESATYGTAYAPFSGLDPETATQRFEVLYSKMFEVNTQKIAVPYSINKKVQKHCTFDGTTANDLKQGHYWLIHISDEVTNGPSFLYNSVFKYYDN